MGKLSNQRTMLQRYNRRQADAEMKQAIEQMGNLLGQLATLPLEKATLLNNWQAEKRRQLRYFHL